MSRTLLLVVAALVGSACGMFVEPPSDEEMAARFRRDRAAFEALLALIQRSPALSGQGLGTLTREALKARNVEPRAVETLEAAFGTLALHWIRGTGGAGGVVFVTWVGDVPGAGHRARGFAWAPKPPPGQPREDGRASYEEYKPLDGNWYLFEELID